MSQDVKSRRNGSRDGGLRKTRVRGQVKVGPAWRKIHGSEMGCEELNWL